MNDIHEKCRVKLDMERCRRTAANLIEKTLGTAHVPSEEYVGLVAEVNYLRAALAIFAETQDEIERALSPVGWGDKEKDGTGTGLVNGGDPVSDVATHPAFPAVQPQDRRRV